jgi:murein DD-endopeptidase MepM/ murein hydrolase activator NlpD
MKNKKILLSAVAFLLVFALSWSLISNITINNAKAVSSDVLKEELEALKQDHAALMEQIAALEKEQADNVSNIEGIIMQKGVLDRQIALLYTEIDNVNKQISTYSLLIADRQEELDKAQKRLDELNRQNKERIRAMEEEGELSYWSVLFKANSFSDLLDRLNMINEIAAADRRRLKEIKQAAQQVADAQAELTAEKAQLEVTKSSLLETQQVLDAKNVEADQLLADLVKISENLDDLHNQFEKEESDFLDKIVQKDQEYNDKLDEEASISLSISESIQASIDASIEESKWIAASIQASIEESIRQELATKPTVPTGGQGGSYAPPHSSGIWIVPCTYSRVSSPFGYRWHPTTGEYTMHKGVDLAAPKGTPIYATRSGYVNVATYHSTAGNYVTINHRDGFTSVYMHMTHYVVSPGQEVKAGQLIGYVGSTGRSTGPHLHFGIHYKGEYVNPMDYIG